MLGHLATSGYVDALGGDGQYLALLLVEVWRQSGSKGCERGGRGGAIRCGYPIVLRCDNGSELACAAMTDWARQSVGLAFIPPGELWRNGHIESSNSGIRDECLNINSFWSFAQARVVDHRLEGRLQPTPKTQLARLPGTSPLCCGLALTDEGLSKRADQFFLPC